MALTVEELVKRRYDTKDSRIIDSKRFLWGDIDTVRTTTKDDKAETVYVWTPQFGEGRQSFRNIDELISFVYLSEYSTPVRVHPPLLNRIFSVNVISGIIALLLTITIVVILFVSHGDVPGILANALTTILGFYFGRATVDNEGNPNPPPAPNH